MPVNQANVIKAVRLIGAQHTRILIRLAKKQDALENTWMAETTQLHDEIVAEILKQLKTTGRVAIPNKVFQEFLLQHYFAVCKNAAESAEEEISVVAPDVKLAKPPIPRSLKDLRIIFDRYRKTGRLPKGFRDRAAEIKEQYLKKTQSVWRKYSEDFRNGDTFTQDNVLRKVQNAADTVESRAKTTVRTETTNYYNDVRTEIYDQSDAIWGYLFLAIRDQGTTKWCTDKVRQGKRGRHGLVYPKGDSLTKKEKPSCHWNCRSEFVPLTMYNPRHRKLIEDLGLRRRNNTCHPLPEGWS
jgi:SPP1 gp7 family putative phage head morphogenesis protein